VSGLEACRLLGRSEIPVTIVDLYQATRGEASGAKLSVKGANTWR
jgi:hypothetical protein